MNIRGDLTHLWQYLSDT